MIDLIGFFILGICVFGLGLTVGWNMRGSVKEENLHQLQVVNEMLHKIRNSLDRR
jgi:hypothetical protein